MFRTNIHPNSIDHRFDPIINRSHIYHPALRTSPARSDCTTYAHAARQKSRKGASKGYVG
jgi:hypothetical protein